MSTHIDHPVINTHNSDNIGRATQQAHSQIVDHNTAAASLQKVASNHERLPKGQELDQGDKEYVLAFENEDLAEDLVERQDTDTRNHLPTFVPQLSASAPADETLLPAPHSVQSPSPLIQTQQARPELSQSSLDHPQPNPDPATFKDVDVESAPESTQNSDDQMQDGGVNYQALLDNLSPATRTIPVAESATSAASAPLSTASALPRPSSADFPVSALPLPAGLPPRPPPQDKPAIHPNYTADEDIRCYHYPHVQSTSSSTASTSQANNPIKPTQGLNRTIPPNANIGSNGLPPPPLATFQQPASQTTHPAQAVPLVPQLGQPNELGKVADRNSVAIENNPDEAPWPPELEKAYASFLDSEAVYVAEGVWDRFPHGSRLFVGNLYSEKVTKRDLFFVFHRYGNLAQISIKNAYGFIQFYDAACSNRALQGEQGSTIRARKIHLEISKPQKNSRNAAATAAGNNLRAGHGRRSRSPDYERGSRTSGGRPSIDRGVPYGHFSGDVRRRDDYRPMRSPSPRAFRGRDEYRGRGRSPDRYFGGRRSRSRSPYGRNGRYRSRSPRGRDMDDEANLPMPRRDPRNVPEVQMILMEEVDRTFVAYIEKTFQDRGLTCAVFQLPRVSLVAVIKRQILEGVQAVVRILRQSQNTGKIPLQVFDYSAGVDNVRFEGDRHPLSMVDYVFNIVSLEYNELDAHIAAELVVRARSARLGPPPVQQPLGSSYGASQYGRPPQAMPGQPMPQQQMPPQQPQQLVTSPNIADLITSLDGPALQKLLGAMSQNPQSPQTSQHSQMPTPQQPSQIPDLSSVLGSQAQQGYPQYQQGVPPPQNQQQISYAPSPNGQAFGNSPALASLLANVGGNRPFIQHQQHGIPAQHQGQPGQQQHVQNIMEQLARWKQ
ncbi:MAG: hypothetical protein LQ352_000025 [Teloschistes flavicans]|nr:MAG: hypothetical protein LQ352_000025 [Teloschistes flavicans]